MMEAGILMMFAVVGGGILAIGCLAAWIWALVDILKNEFTGLNKLIWFLLVIFLPLIGVICYYIIGTKQKLPPQSIT
jgi:heme/copper-type cytochrome/quinol oxidase subunit 2